MRTGCAFSLGSAVAGLAFEDLVPVEESAILAGFVCAHKAPAERRMNSNDGKPLSMTIINTISTSDAEATRPDPLVTCDRENVAAFLIGDSSFVEYSGVNPEALFLPGSKTDTNTVPLGQLRAN
jgi:hypothetical protein